MYTKHIGDNPKIPGSGEQGTLCYRAVQDIFFIRPQFSRTGDIADFHKTQKQTQKGKQNRETEEIIQNERTGQDHSKRLK